MVAHKVVSHDAWVATRKKHLAKEKELTRMRDQLSRERRELPWERVDKDYSFESEGGKASLYDLFEGRSQLVIYHAMFNPDTAGPETSWSADAACFACSWWLDHLDGITVHLHHRDITIAAVSLAPFPAIAAYKERMGWSFPWYSSAGSDFNFDYQVSFMPEQVEAGKVEYNYQLSEIGGSESPGVSVFLKEGNEIYHTYSTYTRGLDMLNLTYHYIDLTPKGRNEGPGGLGEWVRRHDEYPGLMSPAQVLSAVGLIKTSRRRGFCPACRLFRTGDGPQEIAAPALIALAFLIVAAIAWVVTIERMSSMDDTDDMDGMGKSDMAMGEMAAGDMAMGFGSFGSFITTWSVMMAAMMLPTAMPIVFEFAQNTERRRGWRAATALLGSIYLGMWLAFGVVCYLLYEAVGMPWANQGLIGGAALVLAGLYGLTPLKRASEALCRERCALHGPLPFSVMRSAVVAGVRYGLSCLGCSAGLMVAMVLIEMENLVWMIVLAVAVLVYKLAPAPTPRATAALSGALVALGVLYTVTG